MEERDPFDPIEASPRFATPLAVVAIALAVVTLVTGFGVVTGPVGMGVGLVAHVKGSRLGLVAAIACGVALIVSMAVAMYLR